MNFIYSVIGYPLGWVMWACYQVLHNYGLALIVFTIFTKLILLPLGIKQQKSQVKMAMFKPKMDAITKKYANNREKQQEEMAALYQKEGYNPMSGCLPLLIQFPILFGLIDVVYKPLTHILRLGGDNIKRGVEIATRLFNEAGMEQLVKQNAGLRQENLIMQAVNQFPQFAQEWGPDLADKLAGFNQKFLFWDLSQTPTVALNLLILIPILSGITSFLVSYFSMKTTAATTDASTAGMTKGMMWMMPLMSVWIAFAVPAGVGLYWIISNLLAMLQTKWLYKKYNPTEMLAAAQAEEEARKEEERREREERRKRMADPAYQAEQREKAMKQKEIERRKLAEARRRDAEKYGEEYVEVTDEDVK